MRGINFRAWYPEKQKMYEVAKVDMWGDPDQATCDLAAVQGNPVTGSVISTKEGNHETDQ